MCFFHVDIETRAYGDWRTIDLEHPYYTELNISYTSLEVAKNGFGWVCVK